jgi:S-adenosylmethionine:tRNA ribosyltransferase-isomerase
VPLGTDAYGYPLPPEAIAQTPAAPRESARLLVALDPAGAVDHRHVWDLPELLEPGDLLVVNDTRVLAARLRLAKASGGAVEVLLVEPRDEAAGEWEALIRPGRKVPPGTVLYGLGPGEGAAAAAGGGGGERLESRSDEAVVDVGRGEPAVEALPDGAVVDVGRGEPAVEALRGRPVVEAGEVLPDGRRLVRLLADPDPYGTVPLPPYITEPLADPERYQTVYANRPASVAAPTAGLHLSKDLLDRCAERGVGLASVELVVGLDTFRPVTAELPEDHVMHSERYVVPEATMAACSAARSAGRRVVAVGTTSVRALESAAATGRLTGRTDLFIHGDYDFKVVDVLLTNFHLPRSSLLLLLAAFCGERWRSLYEAALASGYRFLSFGDAMLVARRPQSEHGSRPGAGG